MGLEYEVECVGGFLRAVEIFGEHIKKTVADEELTALGADDRDDFVFRYFPIRPHCDIAEHKGVGGDAMVGGGG